MAVVAKQAPKAKSAGKKARRFSPSFKLAARRLKGQELFAEKKLRAKAFLETLESVPF